MEVLLEPYIYEGGAYKHGLIIELLEDLGGYLVQKIPSGSEIMLILLIPKDDIQHIEKLAKKMLGTLVKSQLTGVEVAVISPTLASHHLPHSSCDIAEHLRRDGANTNMIGLARGMGRNVSLSLDYERKLINEHDIALFTLGNFSDCIINKKPKLFNGIKIPIVVTGFPIISVEDISGATVYVENLGRTSHRLRKKNELSALDNMNKKVSLLIEKMREDLSRDPLTILPARVMNEIQNQIPEINDAFTPSSVTLQLDGLRVKLPYDEYHERVGNIEFDEGFILSDKAEISRSKMKNYILVKMFRESNM